MGGVRGNVVLIFLLEFLSVDLRRRRGVDDGEREADNVEPTILHATRSSSDLRRAA